MFSSSPCLNVSASSVFSASAPRVSLSDLERELSQLSIQDRELVDRDLSGGGKSSEADDDDDSVDETDDDESHVPTEVLISQLEEVLGSMPAHETASYRQAVHRCPAFVRKLRTAFMLAVGNNPVSGAARMARYWRERAKLFGPEVAFGGKLTTEALCPEDFNTIRQGGLRVLPDKDDNGRGIIFSDRKRWTSDRDSMMRICWYMIESSVLRDEKMQRNGMVVVSVACTNFRLEDFDRKVNTRLLTAFREYLPVRIVGIHMLMQSHVIKLALPFILWAMGPKLRARFRMHAGSLTDMILDLQEYGISAKVLPTDIGGREVFRYDQWVAASRPPLAMARRPVQPQQADSDAAQTETQIMQGAPPQQEQVVSLSRARAA